MPSYWIEAIAATYPNALFYVIDQDVTFSDDTAFEPARVERNRLIVAAHFAQAQTTFAQQVAATQAAARQVLGDLLYTALQGALVVPNPAPITLRRQEFYLQLATMDPALAAALAAAEDKKR